MNADAVQALLREDREEWAKLVALLDGHPEGPLHDPESPQWTACDVYTHLARLMDGSVQQMEDKLAGRQTSDPYQGADENEVNARVQERYSHMTLDEARAWAHRAFDGLVRAIQSVPLDRWDAQLEFYARADGADHYRGHLGYVVAE